MRIPSRHSKAGRILRVIRDGIPRTRALIRQEADLHPDAEVCRRVRDLRDYGIDIECSHRQDGLGRTIYEYRLVSMPDEIRNKLHQEYIGGLAS